MTSMLELTLVSVPYKHIYVYIHIYSGWLRTEIIGSMYLLSQLDMGISLRIYWTPNCSTFKATFFASLILSVVEDSLC